MQGQPIDLTKGKSIEFSIGELIVSIPELTYKEYVRIQEYENNKAKPTHEEERDIVLWLLNRNTSGKKFTENDLDKLPITSITKIYYGCVQMTLNALNDPN